MFLIAGAIISRDSIITDEDVEKSMHENIKGMPESYKKTLRETLGVVGNEKTRCKYCDSEYDSQNDKCPHCGASNKK